MYLHLKHRFALTYTVCTRLICIHLTALPKLAPKHFHLFNHLITAFLRLTFMRHVLFTRRGKCRGQGGETAQPCDEGAHTRCGRWTPRRTLPQQHAGRSLDEGSRGEPGGTEEGHLTQPGMGVGGSQERHLENLSNV